MCDKIVSHITPAPFVFNLSTDLQYNHIEFKGLLIDLSAPTQLISSFGQLKVLQQFDIFMQFDKNTAGSTNFTFGIESAAFIGSVILDTPIESIIFHIVPVNTPFLP